MEKLEGVTNIFVIEDNKNLHQEIYFRPDGMPIGQMMKQIKKQYGSDISIYNLCDFIKKTRVVGLYSILYPLIERYYGEIAEEIISAIRTMDCACFLSEEFIKKILIEALQKGLFLRKRKNAFRKRGV